MRRRRLQSFVAENATFAVLLVSIGFAWARLAGVTHPAYQAFAHVWVGMLLGLALFRRGTYLAPWVAQLCAAAWIFFWSLNAVEIYAAWPKIAALIGAN